ncbi:MAG: GNAT family N-acetyltransferase [Acidobacteria bacterium]|nr:GNAT family N-acetyltransferase [Acidobacteriota bacterium]
MPVAIRQATHDDLPRLLELYRELSVKAPRVTPERLEAVFARLALYPDYRVFIAFDGDATVGTYALCIVDTLGDRCAPEGIVEDVVVASGSRGRGVGRAMMEHAMARCRDAGCYKLVLSSNLAREEAHRFYDALGFERHGVSFMVTL